MPAILIVGRLRFYIYFDEHGLPHVHVLGPGAEAKILIDTQNVIRATGFTAKELRLIQRVVAERREQLMEAWDEYQK